jgi:8-oxo-dGTP pyrophosphatase MutT (NUDIX family)
MQKSQVFEMLGIALVIVRNAEGKWLCVKETDDRGWWVAGGLVDPPESFQEAAIRETKEEGGIDVVLKGLLRMEYQIDKSDNYQRLKAIFYAEPKDQEQKPKDFKDSESDEAKYLTLKEIEGLAQGEPGWRGPELYEWPKYIEDGGVIFPLEVLDYEGSNVNILKEDSVITLGK